MEKSVLKKQYKIFGGVALALVVLFAVMMSARSVHNDSGSKPGRFYKKDIKNGVDALSDKKLWVEKSTNEIEDIKKRGQKLEEQNNRLQK